MLLYIRKKIISMEIKIQLEKNLLAENVIDTLVSEENEPEIVIGKVLAYDTTTGIAICELYED